MYPSELQKPKNASIFIWSFSLFLRSHHKHFSLNNITQEKQQHKNNRKYHRVVININKYIYILQFKADK